MANSFPKTTGLGPSEEEGASDAFRSAFAPFGMYRTRTSSIVLFNADSTHAIIHLELLEYHGHLTAMYSHNLNQREGYHSY